MGGGLPRYGCPLWSYALARGAVPERSWTPSAEGLGASSSAGMAAQEIASRVGTAASKVPANAG